MEKPTRHVVFNPSVRGSLLQYLKQIGRQDDVVAMFDDLQCGPVEPFDPIARERWFDETLRVDFEPGMVAQFNAEFWSRALDPAYRLVAWTTRHHAQDRIGFLLWAARLADQEGEVVDISDLKFNFWSGVQRPLPVALIVPDDFVTHCMFDRAQPMTPNAVTEAKAELARLGREDGAFRQTQNGEILSLPLTAFDDQLIAASTSEFQKAARVIGTAITDLIERGWYVSDLVLAARLMALVEEGRLQARGDPYGEIRFYEVRLPAQLSM